MAATAAKSHDGNVVWLTMGQRVKSIREQRGMTMDQVAKAAGTGRSMIAKLEAGNRRMHRNWVGRLSKALNVSPEEITKGIDVQTLPAPHARGAAPVQIVPDEPLEPARVLADLRHNDVRDVTRCRNTVTFRSGDELINVDFENRVVNVGQLVAQYRPM